MDLERHSFSITFTRGGFNGRVLDLEIYDRALADRLFNALCGGEGVESVKVTRTHQETLYTWEKRDE